jgi:hypothetical protein
MYILYWLENIEYAVSEQSLVMLLELTLMKEENYQILFYKYIDKQLLTVRNVDVDGIYGKIKGKRKGEWVEENKEN